MSRTKLLLLGAIAALAQTVAVHAQEVAYTVKPGDTLKITVWKEPDLSGPVLVTPDGAFSFPLAGQIDARNKGVTELQQVMVERLKKYISDPVVTISVQEIRGNKIYIIGQVSRPGEFVVNPRVDVIQALAMAGGMTPFANTGNITIVRRTSGVQKTFPFDYSAAAKGKNMTQNIELQAGDVIIVP